MTFTKFIPVAIMVAAVAAIWIWAGSLYGLVLWVPFISWPMYFVYDPAAIRPGRIPKEVLGLTGGIVFGYLTLVVAPMFNTIFGSPFGLPLTVFLVAFIIVMLELTEWFELAPAYFFAYAGYFAYVFGGFSATRESALIPFWLLIMLGLAFGYITAVLRKIILEKEGVYGGAQQTVFDKERPGA